MDNPFELTGPQFLVFYLMVGTVVLFGHYLLRRFVESGPSPRIDYSDPYLLAYLRGGEIETMRVAVVSLIDRRLLKFDGYHISLESDKAIDLVRRPVEAAVLRRAQAATGLSVFFDSRTIRENTTEYKQTLEQLHLLPDKDIARTRKLLL
ncbi:MAG: TIGR04222 domain-containing membrane protein [Deltaproteobacteria bacterium]|nr:TIGR04222 domain-containing membrane protein [Deltaproteobacteria bacterium]